MKNVRIFFVATMVITAGINCVQAKGFQPRIFVPDPEFYVNENYGGPDTVPKKTFVKAQVIQPVELKETQQLQPVKSVQIKPELISKPAQNTTPVLTTPVRKDTALIRLLYEGFKPKTKTSVADKIKIRHIIDSVVSKKDNPPTSSGGEELSYQDLVRIIDSLLKANKIDSTKVIVDTAVVKKVDSTVVDIKEPEKGKNNQGSFIKNKWLFIALAVLVLAGLAFFIMKRRKGSAADPKIFFSYAWDQDEALIMQLYNSLKKDGFNVIKDKENIGYKGVISKFMSEIGSADFIIVAISDKYLKSKFCMYELYEIYRNSGMDSDKFGKKIFPIRIDESINLSDPDVVNGYTRYWKQQEQEWTTRVKEESDSITEEQARQFQFIKRLVNDVNNILSCLADINSLNLGTLKANDFADIKSALRKSM